MREENEGIELMNKHEWLAEQFEANRTQLQAVAYRMLGSLSEADDAVQESWLRLSRSETSGIENLGGWLTTVVARICLDMLRSRNSRREESLEAAVSESIESRQEGIDPEQEVLLADSVGLALLVVLDPEVVFRIDGAASPKGVSREVRGAPAVARQFSGRAQGARTALVDGAVAAIVAPRGHLFLVLNFTIRNDKIVEIEAVADPARLRQLHLAVVDD